MKKPRLAAAERAVMPDLGLVANVSQSQVAKG